MTTSKSAEDGLTIGDAAKRLGIPKRMVRHFISRPDRKALIERQYRTTKNGLTTVEIIPLELFEALEQNVKNGTGAYGAPNVESNDTKTTQPEGADAQTESDESGTDNGEAAGDVIQQTSEADDHGVESEASEKDEALQQSDSASRESKADITESHSDSIVTIDAKVGSLIDASSQNSSAETLMIVATYERLIAEKEARLLDLRASLEAERENSKRLAEALSKEQEIRAQQEKQAEATSPKPRWMFWARR
jgi:hypothetical protein